MSEVPLSGTSELGNYNIIMKRLKKIFSPRNMIKAVIIIATLLLILTSFAPFFYI